MFISSNNNNVLNNNNRKNISHHNKLFRKNDRGEIIQHKANNKHNNSKCHNNKYTNHNNIYTLDCRNVPCNNNNNIFTVLENQRHIVTCTSRSYSPHQHMHISLADRDITTYFDEIRLQSYSGSEGFYVIQHTVTRRCVNLTFSFSDDAQMIRCSVTNKGFPVANLTERFLNDCSDGRMETKFFIRHVQQHNFRYYKVISENAMGTNHTRVLLSQSFRHISYESHFQADNPNGRLKPTSGSGSGSGQDMPVIRSAPDQPSYSSSSSSFPSSSPASLTFFVTSFLTILSLLEDGRRTETCLSGCIVLKLTSFLVYLFCRNANIVICTIVKFKNFNIIATGKLTFRIINTLLVPVTISIVFVNHLFVFRFVQFIISFAFKVFKVDVTFPFR
ncbi:hypothetical protein HELRODRAFT_189977 [Helobdella robusta]|uniref:Uncharacterized protein n=1 Tax=Helobdella robusta TaxID=6412 RepID=T1FRK0_HELRO|nr:hypothetical protein HELRODRAFT_189977 [Helobdella robusta]ESO11488.1 hypothetical protein HELRODRAFT_189977 [Helobdella robusta]